MSSGTDVPVMLARTASLTARVGLALVDFFGAGHMMWASDYPHPDSTWPRSREVVEDETARLPAAIKQGIIRDNAKALYGI